MSLVVSNEGELRLLRWMLKSTFIGTGTGSGESSDFLEIGLFKNDFFPVPSMVFGDLTEADFTGYARKEIDREDWAEPVAGSGSDAGKAVITAPDQVFSSSDVSSQELFGYFILDPSDNTLLWAERFATSRTIENGQSVTIRPKFTGRSETDVVGT